MLEDIKGIQKTLNVTAGILKKMTDTDLLASRNDAFVVLRATLKSLRDRIGPGEAVHLGGQLPALLRGFYYEGWDFTHRPDRSKTQEEFLETVRFHLHGHDDLNLWECVPIALKAVFDSIDDGEAEQVVHGLPPEIQDLCF